MTACMVINVFSFGCLILSLPLPWLVALAAKAILWPIAGIAILGAAAALVSNPVLLQLGVVSGRRKRRDTEENLEPELDVKLNWLKKTDDKQNRSKDILTEKQGTRHSNEMNVSSKAFDNFKSRMSKGLSNLKQEALFKKVHATVTSPVENIAVEIQRQYAGDKEMYEKFIPVPLIVKGSN